MTDIILHHYPMSPFAEKIRTILGAKQLAWKSVIIPRIMPKPDVVALTGGYRKTPILQMGANIICDTALIARKLNALAPMPDLYPAHAAMSAPAIAAWADSLLFNSAVPLAFTPEVLAQTFAGREAEMQAFVADRVAMRKDAPMPRVSAGRPGQLRADRLVEWPARRYAPRRCCPVRAGTSTDVPPRC